MPLPRKAPASLSGASGALLLLLDELSPALLLLGGGWRVALLPLPPLRCKLGSFPAGALVVRGGGQPLPPLEPVLLELTSTMPGGAVTAVLRPGGGVVGLRPVHTCFARCKESVLLHMHHIAAIRVESGTASNAQAMRSIY